MIWRTLELCDRGDDHAWHILPTMEDRGVFAHEVVAVGMKAQEQGLARVTHSAQELFDHADGIIERLQNLTKMMIQKEFIPAAPEGIEKP
ncbi:MAG: hypothetical protein ISS35_09115 [Kiritimatiellae bacterium]|nr:hypothetical protein [Kiritimatiellia bacterium]